MSLESILSGGGGGGRTYSSSTGSDIPNWLQSYQTQSNQSNAALYGGAIANALAPFYSPEEQAHIGTLTQQSISNDNPWMLPQGIGWNQAFLQGISSPEEFGYGSQNTPLWNPQAFTFDFEQDQAGGGGGMIRPPGLSGGGGDPNIEWIIGDYDVGGQGPDWWKPFTVKNAENFSNPAVSATLMMNALIGSGALSDEDARSMAKQLYATWGSHEQAANPWDVYSTKFGERGEAGGGPTMQGAFDPFISEQQAAMGQTGPGVIGMERFSRGRSEQALEALSMMREATVGGNVHEFGPGYQYLQEIAGTLGEAGTADTRAKREQILGALDPMMAMSQGGELGGFSQIAQALASPFYTNLPPEVSRTQAGDYQFGRQSKELFF